MTSARWPGRTLPPRSGSWVTVLGWSISWCSAACYVCLSLSERVLCARVRGASSTNQSAGCCSETPDGFIAEVKRRLFFVTRTDVDESSLQEYFRIVNYAVRRVYRQLALKEAGHESAQPQATAHGGAVRPPSSGM